MKRPTLSPSYLVRNRYSYCFRMRVPEDLNRAIGKTELRYSLKTGYLGIAKSRARLLAGLIQRLFEHLRESDPTMKIEHKYIADIIEAYKDIVLDNHIPAGLWEMDAASTKIKSLEDFIAQIAKTEKGRYAGTSKYINNILNGILEGMQYDLKEDIDDAQYTEISQTLMAVTKRRLAQEITRLQNEFPDLKIQDQFAWFIDFNSNEKETKRQLQRSDVPCNENESMLLSDLIQLFFEENQRAGNWAPRTIPEYQSIFRNIVRLLGDKPIAQITKQDCQQFKKDLMGLPTDYFRAKIKYKDVPVQQVISKAKEPFLSTKTVNKYLDNLKALFDFGVNNADLTSNPAVGLRIKVRKPKAYEEREALSKDDLKRIFYSDDYQYDRMDPAWKFWLPVLALFTGARIEELCQLELNDIKCVEDIWIIEVRGDSSAEGSSGKRAKTVAANRVIPLHPFLVEDLKFIGFVEAMKQRGEKRLFPELKKQSNRWGHYPSRWFGKYKRSVGIASPRKAFHSFRHNFQDNLKQKLVAESVVDELVGHKLQGQSYGRYGKPYLAQVLYREAILKLEYDIDLSHLKKSKWVLNKAPHSISN